MAVEPSDLARLNDMLKAACAVSRYIAGKALADYLGDDMLRSAVERQLEIVGEAARNVSKPFCQQHPEVPWSLIVGQRHVLSHDYGEIQDERVWHTAFSDIPDLIPLIEKLLAPLPK